MISDHEVVVAAVAVIVDATSIRICWTNGIRIRARLHKALDRRYSRWAAIGRGNGTVNFGFTDVEIKVAAATVIVHAVSVRESYTILKWLFIHIPSSFKQR